MPDKNNIVVKDNALITASHRLKEIEQRLVLLAIIQARKNGKTIEELKDKELFIRAEEYATTFGVSIHMAYKALKKAVVGLFNAQWGYRYLNHNGNKVVAYERFTQSAKYIESEGMVSFVFASAIIPMLVQLEKNFTSYDIQGVAGLSSQYAMRLYEFCVQFLDRKTGKGWMTISLDEIRFRFGLAENDYTRMSDFKKRVLDQATDQINQYTDLDLQYEQKRERKKIVGFKFEFSIKNHKKTKQSTIIDGQAKTIKPVPAPLQELTPAERDVVDKAKAYADNQGVGDTHRQNIINKALRDYREDQEAKQAQEAAERAEKAQRAQKQQETLSHGMELYQRLLAADTAVQAQFCRDNMRGFSMLERAKCNQQDYIGLIRSIQYRFESADHFVFLDLSALTKADK